MVSKKSKVCSDHPGGDLVKQRIKTETVAACEPGDVAAVCGVPPSLDSLTFREFVRMANEMGVSPTSLLLKLAPRCGPLEHQG